MINYLVPALFVLAGTSIQMTLSLRDVARSRAEALRRKRAEDELIAELPRLKRRQARREFIRDRDPVINSEIREAWFHVVAWALLFGAALTSVFNILLNR